MGELVWSAQRKADAQKEGCCPDLRLALENTRFRQACWDMFCESSRPISSNAMGGGSRRRVAEASPQRSLLEMSKEEAIRRRLRAIPLPTVQAQTTETVPPEVQSIPDQSGERTPVVLGALSSVALCASCMIARYYRAIKARFTRAEKEL